MAIINISSLLKASCVAFGAFASALPGLESQQATKNLRILPLGDSITYGIGSTTLNGYRFNLQTFLQNSGFEIDYIGDQHSGNMTDNANEGYPGQTISQVHGDGLRPLNGSQPLPNLILLHIGTNDAIQSSTPTKMISDLNSLMSAIYTAAPNVAVVLSQIIMNKNTTTQATIDAYNKQIPTVVSNFASAGKKVVGISQSNINLNNGDGSSVSPGDPTHPGNAGYTKMANNFLGGIQAASQKGLISAPNGTFTPAPHGS